MTTTTTDFRFTADEREAFERDGYLVRRGVFTPGDVADMAGHCEQLVDDLARDRRGNRFRAGSYVFDPDLVNLTVIKWEGDSDVVHGVEPFAHLSRPLADWGHDRRFLDPMRSILGDEHPELFTEKLNLKRPHVGGPNPLHQDYPYWVDPAEDASEIATAIVFLDDSTLENGCLWVVPGSHRDGPVEPNADGTDPFAKNELDLADAEAAAVPVELAAGDVVMFGPYLLHRSAPNTSDKGRRALLYSYQPAGRTTSLDNMRRLAEGRS